MATCVPSDVSCERKEFSPLENNPIVFSQLSHVLGVESTLGFHDIYSIDDPDLLALVPRPVHAVLFTCPQRIFRRSRDAENEAMTEYKGFGMEEPVVWFRQTIGGACGLIALLHGLSNGGAKKYIKSGSVLYELLEQAIPLAPAERAEALFSSKELEAAHKAVAELGDTEPTTEDLVDNHYICFAKGDDGHLWELNGGMKGPVDRGILAEHEDAISDRALYLGVRSIMRHAGSNDLAFSMVAIASAIESHEFS